MLKPRCDIFCRVIDNFGDVGVCWRLARQLNSEHGFSVCLWLDELNSLQKIWPGTEVVDGLEIAGVLIKHWGPASEFSEPADLLIEAFACDIPDVYLKNMAGGKAPQLWLNLEYLSAESWVGECHGLPSIHPTLGYKKIFFFPGFDHQSGGLIRESELLAKRDGFITNTKHEWLKQWFKNGIYEKESLLVSLFAYHLPGEWLQGWVTSTRPVTLLVPESLVLTSLNLQIGDHLKAGDSWQQGALTIQVMPFLSQVEYDHLLWACDINFVRGEDSLVRAVWAGKPFLWQAYPQAENAHWDKIDALLGRFGKGASAPLQLTVQAAHWGWNSRLPDCPWPALLESLLEWQIQAQNWSSELAKVPDLCAQIDALYTAKILL